MKFELVILKKEQNKQKNNINKNLFCKNVQIRLGSSPLREV